MQPIAVHWQYCRDGTDITSQPLYAEHDADVARAWTPDACCAVALARDGDGRWRIDTSNTRLPDDADTQRFHRATHALEYLTEVSGVSYDADTDAL